MGRMACRTVSVTFAGLLLATIFAQIAQANQPSAIKPPYAMRPVMTAVGENIIACGIAIDLKAGDQTFELILSNEKTAQLKLTKLQARQLTADQETKHVEITNAALKTADYSTTKSFRVVFPNAHGRFEATVAEDSGSAGILFQQLLIGGGKVTIETAERKFSWHLSGPAPQNVRAPYLMCAGDLYRP